MLTAGTIDRHKAGFDQAIFVAHQNTQKSKAYLIIPPGFFGEVLVIF